MDLMMLPCAKNVVLQLRKGIMAFRLVSGGDDETKGLRARTREDELVD